MTETWAVCDTDFVKLLGYDLCFINRHSRGGGVADYVKVSLNRDLLSYFSIMTSDCEMLALQIADKIVCVVYRPPSGDLGKFLTYLDKFLDFTSEAQVSTNIGGV